MHRIRSPHEAVASAPTLEADSKALELALATALSTVVVETPLSSAEAAVAELSRAEASRVNKWEFV